MDTLYSISTLIWFWSIKNGRTLNYFLIFRLNPKNESVQQWIRSITLIKLRLFLIHFLKWWLIAITLKEDGKHEEILIELIIGFVL